MDTIESKEDIVSSNVHSITDKNQSNDGTVKTDSNSNSNVIDNNQSKDNSETKPKRRRNRWDTDEIDTTKVTESNNKVELKDNNQTNSETNEYIDSNNETKKPKKKRFAPVDGQSTAPPAPVVVKDQPFILTPEIIQETLILKMKLQHLTEKILTVAIDAMKIEQDPRRSPSPPPKYDSNGKRLNTREQRMREALMNERTKIIEELIKINPSFIPPSDYVKPKPFRKLYVPIKEYPNYNFIGLIIGPRGNTQRQMENETGTKISIRGKGSINIKKNQPPIDEDDDLHIHVQGETEENVEAAAKMIAKILTPVDDEHNEHKQKQLRELALINGTLKVEDYCPICGDKGHRQFECTVRTKNLKAAGVKCSICGELSHPTRDCPFKEDPQTNQVTLDSEYNSFMAELEGKDKTQKSSSVEISPNDLTDNASNETIITIGNKTQTIIQGPPVTVSAWGTAPPYPNMYYPTTNPNPMIPMAGVVNPMMYGMAPGIAPGMYASPLPMQPPIPGQPPMPYNYMGQPWYPNSG